MSEPIQVLSGARVVVGDGRVLDSAVLHLRGGIITALAAPDALLPPEPSQVVDLTGKTAMPALVNPHGHIGYLKDGVSEASNFSRENVVDHLRRLAYYGVGTFQSLGTDRDDVELTIRNDQARGRLQEPLAQLLSAGSGLAAPTPGEANGGPFFAADVIQEVDDVQHARATVRRLAAKEPDVIKFWVDERHGTKAKLAPDVYAAIIDEAHRHGLRVIAHIFDLDDAKGVVRAGVDGLAHLVRAPRTDQELIDLLLERDVFVFSSLGITGALISSTDWLDEPWVRQSVPDRDAQRVHERIARISAEAKDRLAEEHATTEEGLRSLHQAGVRVLLSADTGLMAQFFGVAEHRELEMMARAGMPPGDVLRAGTLLPAQMLGLRDRGVIEVGKRADLLVLDADPTQDVRNTRAIHSVYLKGVLLPRQTLRLAWE
ncbi:MAG: amidohydrolase family protein [Mycobacteriales bacterium]